jgi:hypothetical protein
VAAAAIGSGGRAAIGTWLSLASPRRAVWLVVSRAPLEGAGVHGGSTGVAPLKAEREGEPAADRRVCAVTPRGGGGGGEE